jgi:kynurenine 3-monooxygenase
LSWSELAQLDASPLWRLLNTAGVSMSSRHVQVCQPSDLLAFYDHFTHRCEDIRLQSSKAEIKQRSINLAVSHRGIVALEAIDPVTTQRCMQAAIPMRGRMIHKSDGDLDGQLYDRDGQVRIKFSSVSFLITSGALYYRQCINSISRTLLNEELLTRAADLPNIRIYFKRKAISADFDEKLITFRDLDTNTEFSAPFDFCVGADGSYSIIRRQMMRVVRLEFFLSLLPAK